MTAVLIYLSLALSILGPGIGKYVMNGVEYADPYDGTIYYAPGQESTQLSGDPKEALEKSGFEIRLF